MNRQFKKPYKHSFFKDILRRRSHWDHHKMKAAVFGATQRKDWSVPLIIQDGNKCTGFTGVDIAKGMTGETYDPEAFWQAELQIYGQDAPGGVDLNTQMAAGVKIGFTRAGESTPTKRFTGWITVNPTKNIFNPKGKDMFDSIKEALTIAPLSVGLNWYSEWDNTLGGIIPHSQNTILGAHDTEVVNVKVLTIVVTDGVEYLDIQGTWGPGYGNNGHFYFDRYMANLCFVFGVKYWIDSPNVQSQELGWFGSILVALNNLIGQLFPKNNGTMPPFVWTDPVSARHSVRVICDQEGLSVADKNILCACVQVESNFNPQAVHPNKDKDGTVWSSDYGICQVNDYFNIGAGKPFPSVDYVLQNPEASVRFMCKMWKAGKQSLWASFTSNLYKKYL